MIFHHALTFCAVWWSLFTVNFRAIWSFSGFFFPKFFLTMWSACAVPIYFLMRFPVENKCQAKIWQNIRCILCLVVNHGATRDSCCIMTCRSSVGRPFCHSFWWNNNMQHNLQWSTLQHCMYSAGDGGVQLILTFSRSKIWLECFLPSFWGFSHTLHGLTMARSIAKSFFYTENAGMATFVF